jgi:N-acetylmuramoyl-L-alanine amidase
MNHIARARRFVAAATIALLACANAAAAQDRPIVVLDPGHGGAVAGTVAGELIEKDVVLRVAFTAAAALVRHGYDVRLTRTGDYDVSWDDRRSFAEDVGAALLIMLHITRSDDATRHGAEIYADLGNAASAGAAHAVADALRAAGGEVVVEARPWPFLQSPTVPTVMIELGFATNPVERRLLMSDAFHRELGEAFVRAVAVLVAAR